MRKLLVGIVGFVMAVGLLPATHAAAAAPSRAAVTPRVAFDPPRILWRRCDEDPFLDCGIMEVPLDYAVPTGPTVRLALTRLRHTSEAADFKGSVLMNPGGPGGSGTFLPYLSEFVPGTVADDYDWVGYDPRGVGQSRPALTCSSTYNRTNRPPYVPTSQAIIDTWKARAASYAKVCGNSRSAALLDHIKTTDNVADIESIRVALGEDKLNFYVFSYGTYLAQVYATLHPTNVGKMVLDGVVDPTRVWYQANLDQNVAFDRAMGEFWKYVAQNASSYHLGSSAGAVRNAYYRTLAKATAHPYAGQLGPAELNDVMLNAGYGVYSWPFVAELLRELYRDNDPTNVLAVYRGINSGGDNGYAMYLGTSCTDAAWPSDWATWEADARRQHDVAPFETWGNTWFNAPCLTWKGSVGTPTDVSGAALTPAQPVLLINETLDGATPYSGALKTRQLFPTASLIEGVGGTTHAGSLSGVSCVDGAIARYLDTGAVPARVSGDTSDRQCPKVPVPQFFRKQDRTHKQVLRDKLRSVIERSTH